MHQPAFKTACTLGVCLFALLVQPSVMAAAEHEGTGGKLAEDWHGLKTLGGPSFWTDHVIHRDWRIQKNVALGHYRLLDDRDHRCARGSLQKCYAELARRRSAGELEPMPRHVVIVLHGLAGTRRVMNRVSKGLQAQGFTVLNFGYASRKGSVQDQAVALETVLRNLPGVDEVSFVAHSMGCIVVRNLLCRIHNQSAPPPVAFRRMVMISPPNHGAELAGSLGQRLPVRLAFGKVTDQFAPDVGWPTLERQLATPDFEFGIIAGNRGTQEGYLPRVPGDDDGLLSVQTQRLAGATDFILIKGIHQLMPLYDRVVMATRCFLVDGHF